MSVYLSRERQDVADLVDDAYSDGIFDPYDIAIRLFWYADVGRFYDECGFPLSVEEEREYLSQAEISFFFRVAHPVRFERPGGVPVEVMYPENIYD